MLLNQFQDVNQFIEPELLGWMRGQISLRTNLATLSTIYTVDLSPSFLERGLWNFTRFITDWGKGNTQIFFEDYWILALK